MDNSHPRTELRSLIAIKHSAGIFIRVPQFGLLAIYSSHLSQSSPETRYGICNLALERSVPWVVSGFVFSKSIQTRRYLNMYTRTGHKIDA